jgi:hypothetical protein
MKLAIQIALSLFLVGIVLAILIPSHSGTPIPATNAKISSEIRRVSVAVATYQQSKEKYPDSLHEIDSELLPEEYAYFYDPDSGRAYDWLYFGSGVKGKEIKPDFMIAATPTTFGTAEEPLRIVAFGDGHVETIPNSEFERQLVEQGSSINSVTAPPPLHDTL